MLTGIHQHPDLRSRLACKDANKRRTASRAGEMLLHSRILHRTGSDQSQRVVWVNRRGLSVKVGAWRAGLNPEFHFD
ncbi:hypothetical protein [Paraburkholderia elongata]|uniref:Uncharacterized protein n=1 Tax=Paraburkholderia elongata TaxID=2675747 RepID=A0A972NW30_9BURK|nr:hypothetical protein [Paraburkholderia elongata]NPT59992.1 hypothetical protein [Paraburkholderia elongata]